MIGVVKECSANCWYFIFLCTPNTIFKSFDFNNLKRVFKKSAILFLLGHVHFHHIARRLILTLIRKVAIEIEFAIHFQRKIYLRKHANVIFYILGSMVPKYFSFEIDSVSPIHCIFKKFICVLPILGFSRLVHFVYVYHFLLGKLCGN